MVTHLEKENVGLLFFHCVQVGSFVIKLSICWQTEVLKHTLRHTLTHTHTHSCTHMLTHMYAYLHSCTHSLSHILLHLSGRALINSDICLEPASCDRNDRVKSAVNTVKCYGQQKRRKSICWQCMLARWW